MKSGYSSACYRYEYKRIKFARNYRTTARNERSRCRHLQLRRDKQHPEHEKRDCPDFHERAQIIARAQQHPNRQNRRDKPVCRHHVYDARLRERKAACQVRISDPAPEHDRQKQTNHSNYRCLGYLSLPEPVHVKAHVKRQRDSEPNRECAPWTFAQRFSYDEPQARQRYYYYEQNRNAGYQARQRADLGPCDFGERLAAPSNRSGQYHKVMDRSPQHDSDYEPQQARQEPELGG